MHPSFRNSAGNAGAFLIAAILLAGACDVLAADANDLVRLKKQVIRLQEESKWIEAMPLAEKLVAETAKLHGEIHTNTADALHRWAWLVQQNGDYEKAERLWRRALAIDESIFGTNTLGTTRRLHMLAGLYRDVGDYQKAMSLLKRAVSIREKGYGPNHVETGQVINTMGTVYLRLGDFARAEANLKRALDIFERNGRDARIQLSGVIGTLGWLYLIIGDYEKAEQMTLRAFELRKTIHGAEHVWTAGSLRELAAVHRARGQFDKAETRLKEALAIMEKLFGPDHLLVSELLEDLGELYLDERALDKAELALTRARTIIDQSVGADHLRAAAILADLSRLQESRGDYEAAREFCRRAHDLRERRLGPMHRLTVESLFRLARLDATLGHSERALAQADALQRGENNFLANVFSFTSERQRLVSQSGLNRLPRCSDLWADLGAARPLARAVFCTKGVVLDSLMEDRFLIEANQDEETRELVSRLMRARHRLGQLTSVVGAEISQTNHSSETKSLQAEIDSVEASLARHLSGFGQVRRALSVESTEIIDSIPENAVLLEAIRYHHYAGCARWQENYGMLVLSRRAEPRWVPLGPADAIDKSIKLCQHAVRTPGADEALTDSLREMYQRIWAPLVPKLPAGATDIIVSPDGELNFVSFAALLTPSNRFLGEDFSISYVSSGRDLLPRQKLKTGNCDLLIWANPDFTNAPEPIAHSDAPDSSLSEQPFHDVTFRPLSVSQREGEALRQRSREFGFDETVLHLGTDATEAELRRSHSPRALHLATHGFVMPKFQDVDHGDSIFAVWKDGWFSRLNPMSRSGLALAGAQSTLRAWAAGREVPSENDGIVTADEISRLDLRGTWLVVLSGCDTGAGEALAGEGVLGLRRGFIQAGAQNLLLTLWPMDDQRATGLITDFYAAVHTTGSPPRALAQVQRAWLRRLRLENGPADACRTAGSFILSFQTSR